MLGAHSKIEFAQLKKYIENFTIYNMNEEVSKIFHGIILNYSLSHKIQIPDAIIAATALAFGVDIYTENIKDFKFITGLRFYHPK